MKSRAQKTKGAASNPSVWSRPFSLPGGVRTGGCPRPCKPDLQPQPKTYTAKATARLLRAKASLIRKLNARRQKAGSMPLENQSGLLGIDNILSVSIGEKITRGIATGKPCLIVQVKRKSASRVDADLDIARLHPTRKTGVRTDVQATGPIIAHHANGHYRPCACGASMSSRVVQEGTAGCVVSISDGQGGRELCFLGCNHTFAGCNTVPLDDWILQPSPADGGTFPADAIARLRRFHPLDFKPSAWNEVDCALAVTLPELKDGRVYEIGSYSDIPLDQGLVGRQVAKYGTATGLTYGVITDDSVASEVTYTQPVPAVARFRRLLKIAPSDSLPFSGPGDSGALILDVQTRRPVGLVIGGDNAYSYGCRITQVLRVLNARLETSA
jgi:hypothetical protein